MKRFLAMAVLAVVSLASAATYSVYYKEQYYRLFHQHYIAYPDDTIENIYWLEKAKGADFCNPLYAMAKVGNEREWAKYRVLLDMHIRLKLSEQHLRLGSKYDKRVAYFFNAPWADQNLESLKTAEACYRAALAYWPEARALAAKAMEERFLRLEGASAWEDEAYRISTGDLDYGVIIAEELARLEKVRAAFSTMGPGY